MRGGGGAINPKQIGKVLSALLNANRAIHQKEGGPSGGRGREGGGGGGGGAL